MTDQLLRAKAEAVAAAVRSGDHTTVLVLAGEVGAEAERRGRKVATLREVLDYVEAILSPTPEIRT